MIDYSILDPTGNITALVESQVDIADQPEIAGMILRSHPDVEQVGFVRFSSMEPGADKVSAERTTPGEDGSTLREIGSLRMAGGEFCGNASMCAGALYLLRSESEPDSEEKILRLRVSGAAEPVELTLKRESEDSFAASVLLPPPKGIEIQRFSLGGTEGEMPFVRMEGISHLVVEPASVFSFLKQDRKAAEQAVRQWCAELKAEGLGLMFLEDNGTERENRPGKARLTPLVYIPTGDTLYWENSCASGSAATGMYLAAKSNAPVQISLQEPGGSLRVQSDPSTGQTRLFGRVRMAGQYSTAIQE